MADGNKFWALEVKERLRKSDMVAMRCFKSGIDYPQEWVDYDESLRAILSAGQEIASADIPNAPSFPFGT